MPEIERSNSPEQHKEPCLKDILDPDVDFTESASLILRRGAVVEGKIVPYAIHLIREGKSLEIDIRGEESFPPEVQNVIAEKEGIDFGMEARGDKPVFIKLDKLRDDENYQKAHPRVTQFIHHLYQEELLNAMLKKGEGKGEGPEEKEQNPFIDWTIALRELEDIDPASGKAKRRGPINKLLSKLQKDGLVNVFPFEKGKEVQIKEEVRQELIAKGISVAEVDLLIIKSGRNIWAANEFNQPAREFFEKARQLLETSAAVPEKQPDQDIERTVRGLIGPVDKAIAELEIKKPIREEIERAQRDFTTLLEQLADMRVLSVWQPVPSERSKDIRNPIQGGEERFIDWLKEKGMDDKRLGQMERATFVSYDRPGEQRIFINPLAAKENLKDYSSEQMASLPVAEFQEIIKDLKGMAAVLWRARRRFNAAERGGKAAALQEKQELLRTSSERSAKLIQDLLKTLRQKFNESTLTQKELISAQGELTGFIISATHNEALYRYSQEEGIPPDVRIEDAQAEAQQVLEEKGAAKEDVDKLLITRRVGGKLHIFAPAYLYETMGLDNQTKAAINTFTAEVKLAQQELGDLLDKLRESGGIRPEPVKIVPSAGTETEPLRGDKNNEIGELKRQLAQIAARDHAKELRLVEFGRGQVREEAEKYRILAEQQAQQISALNQKVQELQEQAARLGKENEVFRKAEEAKRQQEREGLFRASKTITEQELRSYFNQKVDELMKLEGKNMSRQDAEKYATMYIQELKKLDNKQRNNK